MLKPVWASPWEWQPHWSAHTLPTPSCFNLWSMYWSCMWLMVCQQGHVVNKQLCLLKCQGFRTGVIRIPTPASQDPSLQHTLNIRSLSHRKLKSGTEQTSPMMSKHSGYLMPLPKLEHTWLWQITSNIPPYGLFQWCLKSWVIPSLHDFDFDYQIQMQNEIYWIAIEWDTDSTLISKWIWIEDKFIDWFMTQTPSVIEVVN